jgi:DNA polymerase-3 subunit beta
MKITCIQENLKRGLAIVSRAVAAKSPLPVLANILLSAENGQLRLAATDLEIGITCWIGARVEEEGQVTIPARLLSDVVGNLPNDSISLTLDAESQTLKVECKRFTSNIKGIAADDYPPVPTGTDQEPTFKIPADMLRQCIGQVAFAASSDESRPVLTGVLIRLGKESPSGDQIVDFVAADGYRLAIRTVTIEERVHLPNQEMQEIIVPARAMHELARTVGDSEEDVQVFLTTSGSQIIFQNETTNLVSRLIDGKFPDFERIIPKEYTTRMLVDNQQFIKAVKLASFFATSNQNFLKLTMELGEGSTPGKVVLNANAAELGDNKSEIDALVGGEGGAIAMNVKFLTEALTAINTSQVAVEIQTSQNPGVFRPVGNVDYTHVIMPMTMR